jgi:hypothetical protein
MPMHSERRTTPQMAKIGPPDRVAVGSPSDGVALLVRATSPACATLLAEKLPTAITAQQNTSGRP